MVYLTGAGPGNLDYLTVKAWEVIQQADCIIYDSLVDTDVLHFCKPGCEKICVGKQKGKHIFSQAQINDILVEKGRQHPIVVRLKGGDPFVFGRGGEECLTLQRAGISYELIPGISSSISVPEAAGIPVTHRNTSRAFTVITGHSALGGLDHVAFSAYAKTNGTLVFLMGITKLAEITARLLEEGMAPSTPVAIIVDGTKPTQHVLRSTLSEVVSAAAEDPEIRTPGIIVVGDSAAFDFRSPKQGYLMGVSAGVVGTKNFTRKVAQGIERLGGEGWELPIMAVSPKNESLLGKEIERLSSYDGVVFTSRNTIDFFFNAFHQADLDWRVLAGLRFIVIGKPTGEYLARYHIHYDACPSEYTSDALGKLIVEEGYDNLFIPRAEQGNDVLHRILTEADVNFRELPVYDTVALDIPERWKEPQNFDYILFGSAMGARNFFQGGGSMGHATALCIGPYTYEEVQKYYEGPIQMAPEATTDSMLSAMVGKAMDDFD